MRETAAQVRRRDVAPCPFPDRSPEEIFRLLSADETKFREQFWFIQWGEIVDNVSIYAYLDDDLVIVLAFRREHDPLSADLGKVFAARLGPDEFVAAIEGAADLIDVES